MKSKLTWILTPLLALMMSFSFAQEKTITGTVTDESGLPLPGVSVLVVGTTKGTQTDFDGNYTINASEGQRLKFSYIGQRTVEKVIGGSGLVNAQLQEDAQALEEVVVTGQGVGISKRRISTTVDVVTSEEIERIPVKQIDQLLQASAPGAQIRMSSGQPGTASVIRSRGPISANGNSTPIFIIDGVRVDNLNSSPELGIATGGAQSSALADIPFESIERIEYIKGSAAATLYGADAANGVVQIFTKKGTVGKPVVFFEAQTGVISGTTDFLRFDETADLVFRNGTMQDYSFGASGGSEAFRYNFSGSLYFDDSFNDVNEQVRRNMRFGFTSKITDKLSYSGSFGFSNLEYTRDYNANNGFARYGGLEGGNFGDLSELTTQELNELKANFKEEADLTDITERIKRFQASNKFTYKWSDKVQTNLILGFDSRNSKQQEIATNALLISKGAVAAGTTDQGEITIATRDFISITGDLNLQYKENIGDNFSFITTAGTQFFKNNDFQLSVNSTGVTDGAITINGGETSAEDFQRIFANYGFYFAENIGLWNKLFFDLGFRIDGNTAFGDDIGLLFLPKVGLSYSVSDEEFFTNTFGDVWNSFKIRANYGEATNFPTPFRSERTIAPNTFLGQQTFTFSNPGNSELTSETVKTTEVGVDLGFFNSRLNLSATYYDGKTEDALFTPPATPSSGQLAQLQNIGEITNTGYEFSLSADLIRSENHVLNVSGSYNYNENLVSDAGGAPEFNVGGFTFLGAFIKEGETLGYLRGARTTIVNGEAVVERNANLGSTFAPKFGSFGLNYSYKNKVNVFVNGDYQSGGQAVNVDDVLRFFGGVSDADRFSQELIDYQEANPGELTFFDLAGSWVEKSDYVKIRNIGASYNFGDFLKGGLIKSLKLTGNVRNPFNWTKASFDPEATGAGIGGQGGFSGGGFGYGTESAPRIYSLTLRATF